MQLGCLFNAFSLLGKGIHCISAEQCICQAFSDDDVFDDAMMYFFFVVVLHIIFFVTVVHVRCLCNIVMYSGNTFDGVNHL